MSTIAQHGGVCGLCGSPVDKKFVVCTGCGATWRNAITGRGALTILGSWILAIPVAVFVGIVAQGFGAGVLGLLAGTVAFIWFGSRMRRSAWLR